MKIIKDNITELSVKTGPAPVTEWPLLNTRNDYPESFMEVPAQTITLKTVLGAPPLGNNALYIGATNAVQGSVSGKKVTDDSLLFTKELNFNTYDYYNYVTNATPFKQNQTWLDYIDPFIHHYLEITASTTAISHIKVTNGGSGYQSGTFTLTATGASACTGRYNVDTAGAITEFIIEYNGIGFSATDGIVATATLQLSSTGSGLITEVQSMLRIGIIRGGNAIERNNPCIGLSEGYKDLSTYLKHGDGTEYIVSGRILRTFSGVINLHKTDSIDTQNEFIKLRYKPAAINLLNNDNSYVCFGKVSSLPTIKRSSLLRKQLNFTIQEV